MLADYGGADGVRDETMLLSALAKAQNRFHYGERSMTVLAAGYTSGVVLNHPFVDGNKRTGFMLGVAFLERNGYAFHGSEVDAVLKTLALAAGELDEVGYAHWLEEHSQPVR